MRSWKHTGRITAFSAKTLKKKRKDYINCDIKKGDIIRKYQEFCEINRKYNTTLSVKCLIADPIYSHKHHRNILASSKWDARFSFLSVKIQTRWAVVSRLPDVGFQCRSDVLRRRSKETPGDLTSF